MATTGQITQRRKFVRACACFRKQPQSGGVTPPALGPRARSWWYNESLASGLFYFNYFMKQTLLGYTATVSVDWCVEQSTNYEWCVLNNASPSTPNYKPAGLSMYRGANASGGTYDGTPETQVVLSIVKCSVNNLFPAFSKAVVYAWNNNSRAFLVPYDITVDLALATWNNATKILSGNQVLSVSSGGYVGNISLVGLPVTNDKVCFMMGCIFDGSNRSIGLDAAQAKPYVEY